MQCPHCHREIAVATPAASGSLSTGTKAQEDRIIQLLEEGPKTSQQLQAAGCLQYTARLWWLRHRRGYTIRTTRYSGVGNDGQWHKGLALYELVPRQAKDAKPAQEGPKSALGATIGEAAACSD